MTVTVTVTVTVTAGDGQPAGRGRAASQCPTAAAAAPPARPGATVTDSVGLRVLTQSVASLMMSSLMMPYGHGGSACAGRRLGP